MSTKKIVALSLIFIGVGIIVAFGIIAILKSNEPTAGLKVETNPPSVVFVDTEQIGTSPIDTTFKPSEVTVKIIPNSTNQNLSTYQTKVRLSDKVYTVIRRDFGPSDKESAGETVSLLPQSGKSASIAVVTSSPEFASISLDGESRGFSPFSLDTLSVGDHQIDISAPGYLTRTISAQARSGYKLTINAKLAVTPDSLTITPTPVASVSATPVVTTSPSPSIKPTAYNLQPTTKITPSLKPTPTISKPYVQVLDTPTGFLRVRSGPATSYTEVGQVKPQATFPLLETVTGWYHISVELEATTSGWITSQYAKKYE